MKVLLRQDKTIEFISGFDEYGIAQITQNDDLVQTLTVSVEVPLIEGREELFVLFESADNSSDFSKRIQLSKVNGDYYTLIPQEIVDAGGTWTFQVIRRRYSADKSKFVETASNKYPFTVGEGVKNAKGELVTKTELQSVYNATVAVADELKQDAVTEIEATLNGKTLDIVGKNVNGEEVANSEVDLDLPYVPTDGGTMTGALEIDVGGAKTSYGAGGITNNGNPITLPQKSGVIALIQDVLDAVSDKTGITFEVVEELPQEGAKTNAIYLVPSGENAPNVYDEFVFINNAWEKIGTTAIDLSQYLQITDFNEYLIEYLTSNPETLTDEKKAAALAWLGAIGQAEAKVGEAANSIAKRGTGGTLSVGTPSAPTHATNKAYVDDGFVAKQNPEFDSGATRGYVYFIDTDSNQIVKKVQVQSNYDTIPLRNANGNFYVGTPTLAYECTPKAYVDGLIAELGAGFNHNVYINHEETSHIWATIKSSASNSLGSISDIATALVDAGHIDIGSALMCTGAISEVPVSAMYSEDGTNVMLCIISPPTPGGIETVELTEVDNVVDTIN